MKELKSKLRELQDLFKYNILVRHVSETLQTRKGEEDAVSVRRQMDKLDFDVMGIEDSQGTICGYVEKSSLGTGQCSKFLRQFLPADLVAESMPLTDLWIIMKKRRWVFILEGNRINGIVTRGDLQKAPSRMFLFGLITLLEMNLLLQLRSYYTNDDTWKQLLTPSQLDKAEKLLLELKKRNEALDLLNCLQFCDKRQIICQCVGLRLRFWDDSKTSLDNLLKSAEKLRDNLAHAGNLVTNFKWPDIIDLVDKIQSLIKNLEESITDTE